MGVAADSNRWPIWGWLQIVTGGQWLRVAADSNRLTMVMGVAADSNRLTMIMGVAADSNR